MLPSKRSRQWLPDIFGDFFDGNWTLRPNITEPAINVIETDTEFNVEVAAPGMTKKDFDIRINEDNQLIVSMQKEEQKEEPEGDKKNKKYIRREFSYSRFQQAMILPDNIEKDHIQATMENGVLNIQIPKTTTPPEPRKERAIEIK